jgi:methylphosphotriester-DNA--protein-cysteine methyltransferase
VECQHKELRLRSGEVNCFNSLSHFNTLLKLILELMLTEGSVQLSPEDLAQALAYTTKHFQRLSQLRAEMHFLTYTAAQMALLPNEI